MKQRPAKELIRLFENDLTDDNSGSEYFRIATVLKMLFSKPPLQLGSSTFPDSGTRQ
jgi:hypothetical protein